MYVQSTECTRVSYNKMILEIIALSRQSFMVLKDTTCQLLQLPLNSEPRHFTHTFIYPFLGELAVILINFVNLRRSAQIYGPSGRPLRFPR